MTRFEPPQVSARPSEGAIAPERPAGRQGPRALPAIRGMSVRRVIGEDGRLDRPLPWPAGTTVDVSLAGSHDA
ncbi:hypothetical protein [Actinoplanes solisilvae]|uniref:hypothetical protein n=1 Tax=Actinoplanes solisilvae TaxID=2486853 RepID=UPI000FD7C41B|nr:hypothetical protein [Actinoplanes solisilvae]